MGPFAVKMDRNCGFRTYDQNGGSSCSILRFFAFSPTVHRKQLHQRRTHPQFQHAHCQKVWIQVFTDAEELLHCVRIHCPALLHIWIPFWCDLLQEFLIQANLRVRISNDSNCSKHSRLSLLITREPECSNPQTIRRHVRIPRGGYPVLVRILRLAPRMSTRVTWSHRSGYKMRSAPMNRVKRLWGISLKNVYALIRRNGGACWLLPVNPRRRGPIHLQHFVFHGNSIFC